MKAAVAVLALALASSAVAAKPAPTPDTKVAERQRTAKAMEKVFLSSGMDVYCSTSGPGKTVMTMKWAGWTRPVVFKFVNEAQLLDGLESAGFKKAVFLLPSGDGWFYDLPRKRE